METEDEDRVKLLARACKSLGFAVLSNCREDEWWLETAEALPRERRNVWLEGQQTFESVEKLLEKFLEVSWFWFPSQVESGRPISGRAADKMLDNPFFGMSREQLAVILDIFQGESVSQESALDKRGKE